MAAFVWLCSCRQGSILHASGGDAAAGGSKAALTARLEALLKSAPILLFMKVRAKHCYLSSVVTHAGNGGPEAELTAADGTP